MTRSIGHSGAKPIMMQNFVSSGTLSLVFQLLKFFFSENLSRAVQNSVLSSSSLYRRVYQ